MPRAALLAAWASNVPGTRHHSEETKEKMRRAAKGRVIPQYVRDASLLATLGTKRPHTEATKERMRAACKGRVIPAHVQLAGMLAAQAAFRAKREAAHG